MNNYLNKKFFNSFVLITLIVLNILIQINLFNYFFLLKCNICFQHFISGY